MGSEEDLEELPGPLGQRRYGVEDPTYTSGDDIEQLHERLDNFEHYIHHLHQRLDYFEEYLEGELSKNEESFLLELEAIEDSIIRENEEQLHTLDATFSTEIEDLNLQLQDRLDELVIEIEEIEQESASPEFEAIELELHELREDIQTIRSDQFTTKEVSRRLDIGLHAPILMGGAIASSAIGLSFIFLGSIMAIPALGLSAFLLLNLRRLTKKHDTLIQNVI